VTDWINATLQVLALAGVVVFAFVAGIFTERERRMPPRVPGPYSGT